MVDAIGCNDGDGDDIVVVMVIIMEAVLVIATMAVEAIMVVVMLATMDECESNFENRKTMCVHIEASPCSTQKR